MHSNTEYLPTTMMEIVSMPNVIVVRRFRVKILVVMPVYLWLGKDCGGGEAPTQTIRPANQSASASVG